MTKDLKKNVQDAREVSQPWYLDKEKLKTVGEWILRIVLAGILIKFAWNIIVAQHNYFS